MQQNTQEWLEWREKGIGASDAPAIMGVSPYATFYQWWQEKVGLLQKKAENFITRFGHEFEIKAQARFELEEGIEVETGCCEHETHSWLRASLDAVNWDEKIFAEIKYMGQEKFDWVKENLLPLPNHHPQVQQQFMVTGYKKAFYIAYTLNKERTEIQDYICIEVRPDYEYIEYHLYPALKSAWDLVQSKTAPEQTEKDRKRIARAENKQLKALESTATE